MPSADEKKRTAFRLLVPIAEATQKLAETPEAGGVDKAESWIQVAVTGRWFHDWYGEFTLTPEDLQDMVDNFAQGKRAVMVDYNHASFSMDPDQAVAAGWTQELETRENGTELWALVQWTTKAAERIRDGEYRFISPEFDYMVQDKQSGEVLGTVLYAIGLCNRPFLEGMAPVELTEPMLLVETACARRLTEPSGSLNGGDPAMDESHIRQILGLSDDVQLTDEHRSEALKKLDEQNQALTEENKQLKEQKPDDPQIPEGQVLVDKEEHEALLQLREQPRGVTLTEEQHAQLKSDAEAGRKAADALALRERQDLVDDGIRAGKVLPAERDRLVKLAETSFDEIKAMIEERPKLAEMGTERGADDGNTAAVEKVAEFVRLKETEYRGDGYKLAGHEAYRRALSDARQEFPRETYEAWVAHNNKAAA